jgi:heavy metal sensor kinase
VKRWSLRNRLAFWTAFLLTVELILFGVASGWVIYKEQLQAFREIKGQSTSPVVIRKEAEELVLDLAGAYAAALPVAALVAAWGVWWITRKALQPLREVAAAAEHIHAKALHQRLPQPRVQDEVGRLVQVLNHAFDRLERSFAQATRFSSDASHELKTPLTIMRGEIESALRAGGDHPASEALLDGLLAQTQRLSGIVEKLLLLSRADAGALTLRKEILDFSAMCHDLGEDAEILVTPKRITTAFEISPEVKVWADESHLRRVLLNLLDNAIKYNVKDGALLISLTKADALARFRIANTGPGIPEGQEDRIFERFYRADLSRSSDTGGSGLGLSLCREIVEAHGGQIWWERPRWGWTAFVVTLPFSKSEDHFEEGEQQPLSSQFGSGANASERLDSGARGGEDRTNSGTGTLPGATFRPTFGLVFAAVIWEFTSRWVNAARAPGGRITEPRYNKA